MKVLIAGSKGMLGQALVLEFTRAQYEVLAVDRAELDVTDAPKVLETVQAFQPNFIINAVAYNGVDAAEESGAALALAQSLNVEVPKVLSRAANAVNATLVHFSSDYVFAGDVRAGYAEDAPVHPINRYGETKAAGERNVIDTAKKYYLIRLSRLFGAPASSEVGKKSFVDLMLALAKAGKTEVSAVDDEYSAPTYAPDLARLVRELAESGRPYGIYHGANAGACTWHTFAEAIFAVQQLPVAVRQAAASEFVRPARRPAYSELLNTKLPPQRAWQEALREYLTTL